MENNLQKYKQELISDLIINGVNSSIDLEKKLDMMIEIAIGGEKEPLIKVRSELHPEIDAHGANDLGFICSITN